MKKRIAYIMLVSFYGLTDIYSTETIIHAL